MFISPLGEGTGCQNMICLLYDDHKYWLSQQEYLALNGAIDVEVSIEEFNSIPDGPVDIEYNGVIIQAKSTIEHCPITGKSSITSFKYTKVMLVIVGIFCAVTFMIKRKK